MKGGAYPLPLNTLRDDYFVYISGLVRIWFRHPIHSLSHQNCLARRGGGPAQRRRLAFAREALLGREQGVF